MSERGFDPARYRGTKVGELTSLAELAGTAGDYRLMVGSILETMADRYERRADYHFIDTKLSLLHGRDHAEDDPLAGLGVVYGWIQGRGLEALAGHAGWLKRCGGLDESLRQNLGERIGRMMAEVLANTEAIRADNGGRMFFSMTPAGQPLKMAPDGRLAPHRIAPGSPANITEVFYVKGMLAVATALGEKAKADEALAWYEAIDADIQAERLAHDQQPLDPTNPAIGNVPHRRAHVGHMLGLGAASLLVECTGRSRYLELGLGYLDHILAHYVNTAPRPEVGEPFDMWEFVNEDGSHWREEGGAVLSDPGHACECVGLALKLLHAAGRAGCLSKVAPGRLDRYRDVLPKMLLRNFANGFAASGYGIVKAFDLIAREPLRTDLPWWSLPETMRAAAGAALIAPPAERADFVEIASKCSNAFVGRYVRPDLNLMAYQTIDHAGSPVDIIPGMPEADPGYHTGLSIIDFLDLLAELTAPAP